MQYAEPYQITNFLMLFKEFAKSNFYFVDRKKNLDCLARLGITIQQAKVEILGLTYEDYYRGPIPDKDRKGEEFWEFGKTISGEQVFIKLKAESKHGVAICFSFHIPGETIEYPYKRRGKEK